MTRSPIIVCCSLLILTFDSSLNTLTFSKIKIGNLFHWQCDMGIVAAILGQFAFMIIIGARMYRIAKVYDNYLKYLET